METDHYLLRIEEKLKKYQNEDDAFSIKLENMSSMSSVLLLISTRNGGNGKAAEPHLILNKRSKKVKQPGDLCCPGGGVSPMLDASIAGIMMNFPFSPLYRWAYWRSLKKTNQSDARKLSILAAAGLREGFEEMRLNPMDVKILGRLPVQQLVMFKRAIHPLVGWVRRQNRFVPNWEVEKIIRIPIRELLNPENYACYCIRMEKPSGNTTDTQYPCFLHRDGKNREFLWGATYRIVENFLKLVFDFKVPALKTMPKVYGSLDDHYLTGR